MFRSPHGSPALDEAGGDESSETETLPQPPPASRPELHMATADPCVSIQLSRQYLDNCLPVVGSVKCATSCGTFTRWAHSLAGKRKAALSVEGSPIGKPARWCFLGLQVFRVSVSLHVSFVERAPQVQQNAHGVLGTVFPPDADSGGAVESEVLDARDLVRGDPRKVRDPFVPLPDLPAIKSTYRRGPRGPKSGPVHGPGWSRRRRSSAALASACSRRSFSTADEAEVVGCAARRAASFLAKSSSVVPGGFFSCSRRALSWSKASWTASGLRASESPP